MRSSLLCAVVLPLIALAAPSKQLPGQFHLPRQEIGACDISTCPQPPHTMSPPTPDLILLLIAHGRGTQNYTCATNTSTPSAIGAVATLTNVSCPSTSLSSSLSTTVHSDSTFTIGKHFFTSDIVPEFDIDGLGETLTQKVENMTAPDEKDVPWLRLVALEGGKSPVRMIYRLNTRRGVAPGSCEGRGGETVVVGYEAEYWIYGCREAMREWRGGR